MIDAHEMQDVNYIPTEKEKKAWNEYTKTLQRAMEKYMLETGDYIEVNTKVYDVK